jgi:hypothetical protein
MQFEPIIYVPLQQFAASMFLYVRNGINEIKKSRSSSSLKANIIKQQNKHR